MGGCAGKKSSQMSSQPTIRANFAGGKHRSVSEELAELRKFYEEEGNYMSRKVKACYEVVFAGDAQQTPDINMKFINLGESGALHLAKVLPCFTNLRQLRLWKTKLGAEGAKMLSGVLPRLPQLKVLSLEDNEIKSEGASYIAQVLPDLPELNELYLHVNKMGQEGVVAFSGPFAKRDNLQILTMDENKIGKPGLLVLLTSLTRCYPSLTLLGLAFNQLGDDGARELLSILSKLQVLKKMTLTGNDLTPGMEEELTAAAPAVDFLF